MQKAARRNSWRIINGNIRLHEELETKKKEIARRHEELEKSVINSTDREKLEATKEEVGSSLCFPILFALPESLNKLLICFLFNSIYLCICMLLNALTDCKGEQAS
jgi:hypothetical protein